MSEYPEHEKLKALGGANQVVGDFIEWLDEQGLTICREDDGYYFPTYMSRDKFIADHFGIDTDKLEKEKVAMLDKFRAGA